MTKAHHLAIKTTTVGGLQHLAGASLDGLDLTIDRDTSISVGLSRDGFTTATFTVIIAGVAVTDETNGAARTPRGGGDA